MNPDLVCNFAYFNSKKKWKYKQAASSSSPNNISVSCKIGTDVEGKVAIVMLIKNEWDFFFEDPKS